jgi:hypothetical protein
MLALGFLLKQNNSMTELSNEQIKVLAKPFIGVEPSRSHGFWNYYTQRWETEDGVPVRVSKQTFVSLRLYHDDHGHVTSEEIIGEKTIGYTAECAQRLGRLVICNLKSFSQWIHPDGKTHLEVGYFNKTKAGLRDEEENEDLFEIIDSDNDSVGPVLFKKEAIKIPTIESPQDLIDLFDAYQS